MKVFKRLLIIIFAVLLVAAATCVGCEAPAAEENGPAAEVQEDENSNDPNGDPNDNDLPDPYAERIPPDEIAVRIDGQFLETDVPPQITDGRTLVPMRSLFEALGAEVDWDGEARTVEATLQEKSVRLTIDETDAFVNNARMQLDVPPQIIEGRTLIPLRFAAEALGADVDWDLRVIDVTTSN